MKNRLALLAILVLVTSFTIPVYAETITVSLISDKEIPYDDSSILIRADVIVDEFDASVGQYFMKIVKLYPSPIPTLTEQKIYLQYLSNDVWKGQIGYMLNDKRVGQYEIQVYSESGSATGSATYSIVESKPAPEPVPKLLVDLEEKLAVEGESEIKKPLMLVEKENILKLSSENKELVSSKNYQAAIEKSNEILEIDPNYLDVLIEENEFQTNLIFVGIIVAIAGGIIFALKKRGKKQEIVVGPALKIKNF